MMSKSKTKKSNIATLSSSSSSSVSLITSIPIKQKTIPSSLEKKRLQQRRNSSSPITISRIKHDTDSSLIKSEFIHDIPIGKILNNRETTTNSTNSLNSSEQITYSPGQYRRSRIPISVQLNSPSHHQSRRSQSASLRPTYSNNKSTTSTISTLVQQKATNSSDLQYTSPHSFRKRYSASQSRDSSPGGEIIKQIAGHYYHNNNINSSHCYYKEQQQQKQQQQHQQQLLNEQKLFHQHQLKKQQHQQYNDNKRFLKDNSIIYKQQIQDIQNNKDNQEISIQTQNCIKNLLRLTKEEEGAAETGYSNTTEIKLNENFNLNISKRKDIAEMSTENTNTDKNINLKSQQENNVHFNDKTATTTTTETKTETETEIKQIEEDTIDNMASKLDEMKVIENDENSIENKINNDESNENVNNKMNIDKPIPNGNCIKENHTIICPNGNGSCPKSSCCPISPITEEEESGQNILSTKCNSKTKNLISKNPTTICSNSTTSAAGANCVSGAKVKRDLSGMTLNLNGPSTSSASGNNGGNLNKTRTPSTPKTPHTPKTPSKLNNPSLANNSKLTPKTPPVTPDSYNTYIDDDLDSVYSYSSGRSTMSCDHPYVARNGTTFSGRKMKYVVHCSAYAGQVGEDYLTPTQRAQRQLRRLKELLSQARQDLEQKDSELLRLTREVVELRLFKASLSSPEDPSNSSDAVTVREAPTDLKTSQDVSPIVDTMLLDDAIKSSPKHVLFHHGNSTSNQRHHHNSSHSSGYAVAGPSSCSSSSHQTSSNYLEKMSNSEMQSSFADSGHFEDMTASHSTQDQACGSDCNLIETYEEQRAELIRLYEKKIEELIRNQDEATGELKQTHNDRIEKLLQKLADINTRYADIVPDYEQAKEKIRELEKQLEDLQQKLLEHEETQKKMYLHMYQKGQEAERIARAEQIMEIAHRQPNRVSIPELLQQLQSTQDELENIRVWNNRERGDSALLTAKEAISLWVLGARKTIYRRLIEAKQNKQKVDPEVTLQFLKSAIYYFLTDKENSQGHLNAIESILEFSEQEKQNINKARSSK